MNKNLRGGDVTVEGNDISFEVLEDLLKYIYTGDAPNVNDHVEELFAAAERYQLDNLKECGFWVRNSKTIVLIFYSLVTCIMVIF